MMALWWKLVVAAVVVVAVPVALVGRCSPGPPQATLLEALKREAERIREREPKALEKSDRLPSVARDEEQPPAPPQPDPLQTTAERLPTGHHDNNICTRHGMQKIKHGRYGWRCR